MSVSGHHFQQIGHQPDMVAKPARGQLNRENGIFPVFVAPERLVPRVRFSSCTLWLTPDSG